MAQPTGQVLLDAAGPNYAATSFWYANDTGLWDAKAGAMLAKTGAAGLAVEGGANVALGNGATYYALATAFALAGQFTIILKPRTATDGSTASMVFGSRSDTNNFFWLASSGTQATLRINGSTFPYSNTASATAAVYALVRGADNLVRLYKNSTLVGTSSGAMAGAFVINHLLSGYTGTSFILNGALEFMRVVDGVAMDATEVASYSSDPYQGLVAAAGVDATATGVTVTASSSFIAGAASGGVGNFLTITSPTLNAIRQRSLSTGVAAFTVSGSCTSTAGAIEYRWGGSGWATLVAAPAGGAFSQTLILPTGQGTLELRLSADNAVTASVALVTVGDIHVPAGQSNHVGAATSVVPPVAGSFTALEYLGGAWTPLREGTTESTNFSGIGGYGGSYFGALSNRLQAQGVPVGFIPCASGSTSITQWQKGGALYTSMMAKIAAVGGVRSVMLWQGETDAASGMAQATHEAGTHQFINDVFSDIGVPVFMHKIVRWIGAADTIRAAQDAVIASNPHVAGWCDCDVYASSGVHYLTTTDINNVADVVYAGMVPAFYGVNASASGTTWTAVVSLLPGIATGQRSASVPGATLLATASLLPGAAGGGSSAVVGGTTWLATATLLAGAAAGGNASTAPGATLSAVVSFLPGAASGQRSASVAGAVLHVVVHFVPGAASDGTAPVIWPAHRAGTSHTATVPMHMARYVVEPGDELSTPLRTYPVAPGSVAVIHIDWATLYLARAADEPGTLHAVDVEAGITATPSPALGQPVPAGVVAFTVPAPAAPGSYTLAATLATVGGRLKPATLLVQALAEVPIAKTFPLDQGSTEVFEVDFDATLLASLHDTATELAAFSAPGAWVQAEYPPGTPLAAGVVRLRAVAPSTAGDYDVITAVRTAAGRVEPARVVLRVNPAD